MDRQTKKLVDESKPGVAPLECVGAGGAMSQFCQRDDRKGDFLVAAVARDGGLVIPDGDYVVSDEDAIYLLGTPQALSV